MKCKEVGDGDKRKKKEAYLGARQGQEEKKSRQGPSVSWRRKKPSVSRARPMPHSPSRMTSSMVLRYE